MVWAELVMLCAELTRHPYNYVLKQASMQQRVIKCQKVCLFVLGFTAQSTQWGHVERGQFT